MDIAAAVVVSVFALVCVALTVIGLPGTWLMIASVLVVEFFRPDVFSWGTIIALGALAVIGEVLETLSGAIGAGRAGASKRAGAGAIVGGIAGAILGSIVLAVLPIIGTLIGSVVGAAICAVAMELTKRGDAAKPADLTAPAAPSGPNQTTKMFAGVRTRVGHLRRVGTGAAIGRALSIVLKGAVALIMAVVLSIAAFAG